MNSPVVIAQRKTRRKQIILIGLAAILALWAPGCTVSDDLQRIRHPLRYEIEQTGGTAEQFEEVVRNHLAGIEQIGYDLKAYLKKNDFRYEGTVDGADWYRLKVGGFIETDVVVGLSSRDGWQVNDVRVFFTGP